MSSPNAKEEGLRSYMSSSGIPVEWIRRLLESDTITDILLNTTKTFHVPIASAGAGTNAPGQEPTISVIGTTQVAEMTLNTDAVYRIFKVPENFLGSPVFEAHWTKQSGGAGDSNQGGKVVRWRMSYVVFNGDPTDINVAPTVVEVEDTYVDTSADSSRIMYKTGKVALTGVTAGDYISVEVDAMTPVGTAMTVEPALASIDFEYLGWLNQ